MHLAPAEMEGHVWMRRMVSIASVLKDLSRHTATHRWTNVAVAPVSTAPAGMTSMVTAVTVNQDGWEKTVISTGTTVYQVPARTLEPASTNSMGLPVNVDKALEVTFAKSTSMSVHPAPA